jgi:beta-glucosidase
MRLPEHFLLGTASAAHQVEGGLWNDWMRMERDEPWRIRDGSSAATAIDHYRRYREDLELLAGMGHTAQRFSIEWARVEPEPGRFDHAALRHYADYAGRCRELGMEPVVTLHHFTLPVWLADQGGVNCPAAPRLFARYAAACAEALGDRVRWWITLNEPEVLLTMGFAVGEWPPHHRSLRLAMRAGVGMLRMHAAATAALRRVAASQGRSVLVSIAHAHRPLVAPPGSGAARLAAPVPDFLFNRWFLRSCIHGRVMPPAGRGQAVPGLLHSLDYIGLNFYCEDRVRFDPRAGARLFVSPDTEWDVARNSLGWPIDAGGLRRSLVWLWEQFHLPLLVTENGVTDRDDELRPRFLVDHLGAVLEAISEGVDVRGYLHWTGFDNFEWLEGYAAHFGLIAVDRDTLERRPKPSSALFAEICRTGVVPAGDASLSRRVRRARPGAAPPPGSAPAPPRSPAGRTGIPAPAQPPSGPSGPRR